ncbi:hypothetical protein PATA110615_16100 [Paenibacillus taichungensis]
MHWEVETAYERQNGKYPTFSKEVDLFAEE